jgi:hypothetical protein
MDAVRQFVGIIRAGYDTLAAGNASVGVIAELSPGILSLGVMTPETAHRASLKENGRSDARAVVQGETLDIENNIRRCHVMTLSFPRQIAVFSVRFKSHDAS